MRIYKNTILCITLFFPITWFAFPIQATAQGSYQTGIYTNYFASLLNKSEQETTDKIDAAWDQLFNGGSNETVYYDTGPDAYIHDVGNNRVNTEGLGWGMMIAVQLDKKSHFDKLWTRVKSLQHQSGPNRFYTPWSTTTTGQINDQNPAPDGEIYFVTSLFFAAHRWGDDTGINYTDEANLILDAMLHQADDGEGENMFNHDNKLVVFTPIGTAAEFTDPSYNTPAFLELWALWAQQDNDFWADAAIASRTLLNNATHPMTGLAPNYSEFDGSPKYGFGDYGPIFSFDAWRVAMNISIDKDWWDTTSWSPDYALSLRDFFYSEGIASYVNQFEIDGTAIGGDHSPGLVAMNATTALTDDTTYSTEFVQELWNLQIPTGQWRYYDGMLYMLALLKVGGRYQIWHPQTMPPPPPSYCTSDYDQDGDTDTDDLSIFAANYRTTGIECSLDLASGDCFLDLYDLELFAHYYSSSDTCQ